jgi:hypothetical protein
LPDRLSSLASSEEVAAGAISDHGVAARLSCRFAEPRHTRLRIFLVALVAVIGVRAPQVSAQGGPPMLTDDPDTPGNRRWEINIAVTGEDKSSQRSIGAPHIDLNYGLGDRIQLKYETGWLHVRPSHEDWISGLDNSLIGAKWRFAGNEDSALKASVYPQYEFENGTKSVERGVAEPGPNFLLPVEVSRSFGEVTLVAEVAYQFLHAEGDEWIYGALAAFQATEDLELLAELHGSTTTHFTNWDPVLNVGLRRELGERFKLLASLGTGLSNDPERTRLVAYVGVQVLLGKERQ